MICTVLVVGFLLVASYTDIRWRTIFNGTTYSGIIVALLGSVAAELGAWRAAAVDPESLTNLGFPSFFDSLQGLLACGGLMLVCYVLFVKGMGGGDVKLLAMIGAFLGLMGGLEATLWTFVVAACLALIVLVWRVGFFSLCRRLLRYAVVIVRSGRSVGLNEEDQHLMKTELFLSPSALIAVLIVRLDLLHWI